MAEELKITATTREKKYEELIPQLRSLLEGETDMVANLANVCAALKQSMGFFWVGFYLVKNGQLVLGPFQGPVACTRINKGKGVCGTAWETKKVIIVPDVDKFPGHIACSSASRSEIVLPILDAKGNVTGVLDADSDILSDFDATDEKYLQQVIQITVKNL
jgi:L-methionine (R)-S-oxide reductase